MVSVNQVVSLGARTSVGRRDWNYGNSGRKSSFREVAVLVNSMEKLSTTVSFAPVVRKRECFVAREMV